MGITFTLRRELIDTVMKISCKKNVGLVLDADLTQLVVDADVSVRPRNCSDPRFK